MDDKKIIEKYGGPTKLAELLGFGSGGAQRVHNWTKRGIPAAEKLNRPDIFLPSWGKTPKPIPATPSEKKRREPKRTA